MSIAHRLKILSIYFKDQISGRKTFEIRKHDRNFKVGDQIILNEIDAGWGNECKPTGRICIVEITHILHSSHDAPFEGLKVGYSILSTKLIYKEQL